MEDRRQFLLRIEGMTCEGCARHVIIALKGVAGVEEAEVGDWKDGTAIAITGPQVSEEQLSRAIAQSGYRAIVEEMRKLKPGTKVPRDVRSDFDLMIVGAGSAAFAAAIKAAEIGSRVAMVEQSTIGGTCVNIGCVPSKTLIKAAEVCYHASYSNFKGMAACPPPSEWQTVLRQKDELIAALRQQKYINVLKAHPNVTLIHGHAELTVGQSIRVGEKSFLPGKIIIATGSRPFAPPIPGLRESGFIDSEAALSLRPSRRP